MSTRRFVPRISSSRQRNVTIRSPSLARSHFSPTPGLRRSQSREPSAPVTKSVPVCEQCENTVFENDNGSIVCTNCGKVQSDLGNFANDIGFAENDAGRTQQIGTLIRDGQTHSRATRFQGAGHAGQESQASAEKAHIDASNLYHTYCHQLRVQEVDRSVALSIFDYAYLMGFCRGRTVESVALVALYLATRKRNGKDQKAGQEPTYSLMLIDFAEVNDMNVFDLGRMMQDMVKKLYIDISGPKRDEAALLMQAPGAEMLIGKFVDHLDFPSHDAKKVKDDAIRILSRMKRDWLHDGRRPSGVCGAAVILAARMNNYRRTLREVVLCAKVTEFTITKRLEEFQDTASSKLSVDDFRDEQTRNEQPEALPPAFLRGSKPKRKRKRGKPKTSAGAVTAAELEDEGSNEESEAEKNTSDEAEETSEAEDDEEVDEDLQEPPEKRTRVDADGFAVPAVPDRSAHNVQKPVKRGPGKPKGTKMWRAPPPTEAELAYEAEMQHDIEDALAQNEGLDISHEKNPHHNEHELSRNEPTQADVTPLQHETHSRHDPPGPTVRGNEGNTGYVSMDPILGEDEFEDDPEVANCLLNEAERTLKERIWVTENAEWLRQSHAKKIRRELKRQQLLEQGVRPEDIENGKRKNQRRNDGAPRSGRTGDVRYLNDKFHTSSDGATRNKNTTTGDGDKNVGHEEDSTGDAPQDAEASVQKMFIQRLGKDASIRLDYKKIIADAYRLPDSSSISPDREPSQDRAGNTTARARRSSKTDSNFKTFGKMHFGLGQSRQSIAAAMREKRRRERREQARRGSASPTPESGDEPVQNDNEDSTHHDKDSQQTGAPVSVHQQDRETDDETHARRRSTSAMSPEPESLRRQHRGPYPTPTQTQTSRATTLDVPGHQNTSIRRTGRSSTNPIDVDEIPSEPESDPESDGDVESSALSSTHTPQNIPSGIGTPVASQAHAPNTTTTTTTTSGYGKNASKHQENDNNDDDYEGEGEEVIGDVESDEGDYVEDAEENEGGDDDDEEEEEEEEEDEDVDDGIEKAFAGGDGVDWEDEEVVEE